MPFIALHHFLKQKKTWFMFSGEEINSFYFPIRAPSQCLPLTTIYDCMPLPPPSIQTNNIKLALRNNQQINITIRGLCSRPPKKNTRLRTSSPVRRDAFEGPARQQQRTNKFNAEGSTEFWFNYSFFVHFQHREKGGCIWHAIWHIVMGKKGGARKNVTKRFRNEFSLSFGSWTVVSATVCYCVIS